jgi:CRISPR/Cas system CMR-associated protein Cmr5 small subunit
MVSKIRYASETLNTLEQDQKAQHKAKEEEYQSLKDKVASISDPSVLEDTIAQYKKQVKDLDAVSKKQQEENLAKKQAFLEELNTAMTALEEYLNNKRIQLENFDLKVKNSKQDVVTLSEADQALLLLS